MRALGARLGLGLGIGLALPAAAAASDHVEASVAVHESLRVVAELREDGDVPGQVEWAAGLAVEAGSLSGSAGVRGARGERPSLAMAITGALRRRLDVTLEAADDGRDRSLALELSWRFGAR